ncbi:MAG TPA: hypothetical protein DCW90_13330 [Lachnospiraceae bacterium]|nr:hypothetical protein [Lachnospiraceae bacterium]
MSAKTFNTRIGLKYDTYANWVANNPTPLQGEVCVTVIPADTGAVRQEPAILFKVGDGTRTYTELDFTSAKAADIYDWAKQATKPTYTAAEITGLADFVSGEIQDTNTQYKIEADEIDGRTFHLFAKEIGGEWTKQNTYTVPAETVYTLVTGETNGTVKFNDKEVAVAGLKSAAYEDTSAFDKAGTAETKVKALADGAVKTNTDAIAAINDADTGILAQAKTYADGKASTAETNAKTYVDGKLGILAKDKTVAEMIEDAKTAATYDDTALTARVAANEKALETLNGEGEGSVSKAVADGIATVVAGADADFDTLKEVADWIKSDTTGAAKMQADIATLKGGDTVDGSVAKSLKDAKAYTDEKNTAMDTRVDTLEKAIGEGGSVATQITTEIGKLDATVASAEVEAGKGIKVTVTEEDGRLTGVTVTGNYAEIYDAKGAAATAETNAKTYADGLAGNYATAAQGKKADTAVQTVAAGDTNGTIKVDGKNVTVYTHPANHTISEVTGLQDALDEKVKDADLATIAKSGNVNDLVQTAGDYIVINCGSATTVI